GDPASLVLTCGGVGLVTDSSDCDDTDPSVHPGATETCDGRDEDCDGVVDDGAEPVEWCADVDGDGHGDPADFVTSCAPVFDRLRTCDDCDDADATVFPGAAEVCDQRDDDCDGQVDEDVADPPAYYADIDQDGYGGAAQGA